MRKKILFKSMLLLVFLAVSITVSAQETVSGKVVDSDGFAIPGVAVYVENTSNGTITDIDGNFSISLNDDENQLTFSFVGFKTKTVSASSITNIDIVLEEDIDILETVVVTGYGQTQNKALVSSSISSLGTEAIEARPIANVEQAIQGNAPSVVVVQESGSPGASNTVRIRGTSTAGDASPLVLVNGVQVPDMNFINPNDIENVSVFRDAASSAIYGARGGNGVLYLETKGADEKGGKLNIDFSSYYGVQSLLTEGEYLTGPEYAEYYNESVLYQVREDLNIGGRSPFSDEEMSLLPNTTWIREVSDEASISDVHMALSGRLNWGTTGYYASFGDFNQEGIIGNTSFNRRSGALGIDQKIGNKLSVNVYATYSDNFREYIAENSVNSRLISSIAGLPAIYPSRDENGNPFDPGNRNGVVVNGVELNSIGEFGNPLVGLENVDNYYDENIFYGNATISYDISDKLKANAAVGYLDREGSVKSFGKSFSYVDSNFENLENSLYTLGGVQEFKQFESYLNYSIKNSSFDLDLVGGMSLLENSYDNIEITGRNFAVNTIDEVSFDNIVDVTSIDTLSRSGELNTTVSYYARANATVSDKYLFSLTLRTDASSKFGPNNKWGFFPSLSAGWLISDEPFLKNSENITMMKIRTSYGINGNDKIPAYGYVRKYEVRSGRFVPQDFNPDIKWEEISQFNIGFDLDVFKNKLGITLDYYIKDTKDMLLEFDVPAYTGIPAPVRNAGDIRNSGFEAIFLYRDELSSSFRYEVNFNFATIKNEVLSLNGGSPIEGPNIRAFESPNLTLTDEGSAISSFYGYIFDGLDGSGNPIYRDLNDDGEITDEFDRTFIGNPFPDLNYGFTLKLFYKRFDLSTFIQGTQGNDVVNSSILYSVQYANRTRKFTENAWTHSNTNTNVMRPSATQVVNNEFSDYYVEDGSYMRIKNVTLAYKLPKGKLLKEGRVYISANNIFTATDYSGLDPEIGENNDPTNIGIDQGFYPQAKSFLLGVNLSF